MRTCKLALLWPDSATDEEIRDAIMAALRRKDRESLERIAAQLEADGSMSAALTVRAIAETKPHLH
jgi:hypothetical protein